VEFAEAVRRRRMVRNYDPDRPVPTEVLDRIVAHGLRAPSAGFSQGWGFLVLTEPADRDRFWRATVAAEEPPDAWLTGMRRAPALVVVHSNKDRYLDRYAQADKGWTDRAESRWPVPYWHIDAGMAALLMLLTAVDEQLGACFFGIPPSQIPGYRLAFGVPDEYTPIGAVSLGYPAPDRRSGSLRHGWRPVAEVVHYGQWGSGRRDA
jgi:nitroreductase